MSDLNAELRETVAGPPPLRTLLPAAGAMTAVWFMFFAILFLL